ncbi:hypothetical protein [Aliidongia dinghuensis]|uniref:hypothetical protein n=1 Tax=Aliidongia dinghuensis TaxID=1867774 RepID=UPI00166BFF28|nr:hypothetical protein [Aliidongia dinghuensis]
MAQALLHREEPTDRGHPAIGRAPRHVPASCNIRTNLRQLLENADEAVAVTLFSAEFPAQRQEKRLFA